MAAHRNPHLESSAESGYTKSMKTAISVPDEVFEEAERLAQLTRKSRSQLYSEAMAEYLARHSPDDITNSLNAVVQAVGQQDDAFASIAGQSVLERVEW